MANRDDIVIKPTLEQERAATPTRGREGRVVLGDRKKGRLLRRVAKARAARRVVRGGGARGGAGISGRLAGMSFVVASVVALVAARLLSGRSFGGMGAEVKRVVLGDVALRDIARQSATRQLLASPHILRVAARTGTDNPQIRRLHEVFEADAYREAKGAATILESGFFDVNNTIDLLILRAQKKFLEFGIELQKPSMVPTPVRGR